MAIFSRAASSVVLKKRGVWLGPLTKAHPRRPGPTLWARCEAIEVGGVYIEGQRIVARVFLKVEV